jgi:hypothetical protein
MATDNTMLAVKVSVASFVGSGGRLALHAWLPSF